jgi:hypothetical protein
LLQSNKEFLERVAQASLLTKQMPVTAKKSLPELQIDQSVAGPVREKLIQWIGEFHSTQEWQENVQLLKDFFTRFKDELAADRSLIRFVKFAERIVYEHAPSDLSEQRQEAMKRFIAMRILNSDKSAPYMTVAKARAELEAIERERAQGKKKWEKITDTQIRSLKLYYTSIEKEYAAYAPAAPVVPPVVNDNTSPSDLKKESGPKL